MRWLSMPGLASACLLPVLLSPLLAQGRGAHHLHLLPSATFGEPRELRVYTPPGYDPMAPAPYPLLILLHGAMGRPSEWTEEVHADQVMEALLRRGEILPMVLALPEATGYPAAAQPATQVFGATPERQMQWMDRLGQALDTEILPFLTKAYHLRSDAEGRALAGFSMGGAEALYLGLRRRDRFAHLGAFAGAYVLFGGLGDQALPPSDPPPRLLWMACGTGDLLLGPNRAVAARLGVPLHEVPGGHTAEACRDALAAFLPNLFRPTPSPRP